MSEAFEKHKDRVISEMHERFLIYRMEKKKERLTFGQHAKRLGKI